MGAYEATWDIPNSVEQHGKICKVKSRKASEDSVENLGKARGWERRRKAVAACGTSIAHRATACVRAKSPQLERSQLAVTRKADPLRVSKMLFEGSSYLLVEES